MLDRFGRDEFLSYDVLSVIEDIDTDPVPIRDGSVWINTHTTHCFYGNGYERGDPRFFVRLAEWLEGALPGAEIYYGHDNSDELIELFDPATRQALLSYYDQVGHEPYRTRLRNTDQE